MNMNVTKLSKYVAAVIISGLLVSLVACGEASGDETNHTNSSSDESAKVSSSSADDSSDKPTGISFFPDGKKEEVLELGEKLILEHDIQYNQSIRFSYDDLVFESYGDVAITSIEDARNKFPDWPIPEKIGDYHFEDLTLEAERTVPVSMDLVRHEMGTTKTITKSKPPVQYYLCYKNASSQFRISMLPLFLEGEDFFDSMLASPGMVDGIVQLPSRPDSYLRYEDESENESEALSSVDGTIQKMTNLLLVRPKAKDGFAFWVEKLDSTDCLENVTTNFTEKEAISIRDGIWEAF